MFRDPNRVGAPAINSEPEGRPTCYDGCVNDQCVWTINQSRSTRRYTSVQFHRACSPSGSVEWKRKVSTATSPTDCTRGSIISCTGALSAGRQSAAAAVVALRPPHSQITARQGTMRSPPAAAGALAGLVEGLEQIPPHLRRSITFDQGSEWALWADLAATYNIDIWFCDPHSPWQRGQIENLNRQWRWWFPRGTDLAGVAPDTAQHAADIINGQRRRLLDYQAPATLYHDLTVR